MARCRVAGILLRRTATRFGNRIELGVLLHKTKFSGWNLFIWKIVAWRWDKKSWLSSNELSSIQNILKHVRLHLIASGTHEKPGEKWLTRSQETKNESQLWQNGNGSHYSCVCEFQIYMKEETKYCPSQVSKIFSLLRSPSTNRMFS